MANGALKDILHKGISHCAFSVLAALSISIATAPSSTATENEKNATGLSRDADGKLVAGFPFHKKNKEEKQNDVEGSAAPEAGEAKPEADKATQEAAEAKSETDKATQEAGKATPEAEGKTEDQSYSNAKGAAEEKKKKKAKAGQPSDKELKKKAKAEEKAAAKAQDAKEAAEKKAGNLAKKSEKEKEKEEKKQRAEKAAAEKAASESAAAEKKANEKAASERAAAEKTATEKAAAEKAAAEKTAAEKAAAGKPTAERAAEKAATRKNVDEGTIQSNSSTKFAPDTALLSLLNDLARELSDSDRVKLKDEDQKFVVKMALNVLNKSLEKSGIAPNRIVEKKTVAGNAMCAEAWSSGDVKVSDDCRGSVAAVWGKKQNGLINLTMAGFCSDKSVPSGKPVGEYIVVLQARSTIEKGFDIQSQSDVNFWLAKVSAINVEADCCSSEKDNSENLPATTDGELKEIRKNATVVLQAITTERERLFNAAGISANTERSPKIEDELKAKQEALKEQAARQQLETERQAKEQQAKLQQETERRAKEQEEKERAEKLALAEKKKQDLMALKKEESEAERKIEEAERQAKVEKEKQHEEKKRIAEEAKDKKSEEKVRLAKLEKEQKLAEKEYDADQKRQRKDEKKHSDNRDKSRNNYLLNDDAREQPIDARRNYKMSRDDMILAEAARQAELESRGITTPDMVPGFNSEGSNASSSRQDAILAQAAREAELERREAADMRPPYNSVNAADTPTVEIGEQKTMLRPTPSMTAQADSQSENTTAPMIAYAPTTERQTSPEGVDPGAASTAKPPGRGSSIVIPERAIAGQHVTAAVIDASHAGESGVELQFNGVAHTTDPQGQITYLIPEDAVPGNTLNVTIAGGISFHPMSIEVFQPLTTSSQQEVPSVERTSAIVSANGLLTIDGHNFDGVAEHNKVWLDENRECKVISASPVQLRAMLPASVGAGAHLATVEVGSNKSNPGKFSVVTAEVQPDPRESGRDQITKLVVKVLGTTNKLQVHLINQSPDVLKISKGNDFRLTTQGGSDNSATIAVQRLRKGSYKVSAAVE